MPTPSYEKQILAKVYKSISEALAVEIVAGIVSGDFTASGLKNALKTTVMTITDTPQQIPVTPLANRNTMAVRVIGANPVFFGADDVSVENGYLKTQFEEISLDIKDNPSVGLWAVCEAGKTCEIRVLEVS